MAEKTLSVKLSLNDKQFQSALRKSTRSIKRFGSKMQGFGQTLTRNITLPVIGLGAAAVKLASDFEETQSKFNTVFKDISDNAQEASKELSSSFGLSSRASMQLLSDTGDLLTGFGFTQEEALKLSTEVNQLAVDLASFTNFSGGAEGASLALTKALLGERESIKQLGIAITEADLKQFAADQGLVFKELGRVEKANLTFQLALKQSANAVGDFARTSDSFANQLRQLKSDLEDVAVELGVELLPIAKSLVVGLRDLTKFTSQFSSEQKKGALKVAGFAAALGPILTVGGKLVIVFGTLRKFFLGKFLPAMRLVAKVLMNLTPQGRIISGLIVAASFLVTNWGKVKKGFDDLVDSTTTLLEKLGLLKKQEDLGLDFSIQEGEVLTREEMMRRAAGRQGIKIIPKKQVSPEEAERKRQMAIDKLAASQLNFADSISHTSVELKKVEDNFETLKPIVEDFAETGAKSFSEAFFDFSEEFKAELQNTFTEISNLVSSISNLFSQIHNKRMIELDNEKAKELDKIAASKMSEEEKENAINAINAKFDKKKAEADKKQAKRAKAMAILEATVATAAAVVKALPNIPLSIAASVIGAAQIATIASTQIPAFAEGGLVSGATLGLIGEGPGTSMSNPEVIAPLDKLQSMIGQGNGSVEVFGRISGSDILISSDRARKNRDRTRGY
tara:strand:- start:7 stop:2040 length:2034 start_codon:yes stop_codon:yes gene_type:complete